MPAAYDVVFMSVIGDEENGEKKWQIVLKEMVVFLYHDERAKGG